MESLLLRSDDPKFGYNAATGKYEDLMAAGIIDPAEVVRCCLEHAASVAKTFLNSLPRTLGDRNQRARTSTCRKPNGQLRLRVLIPPKMVTRTAFCRCLEFA